MATLHQKTSALLGALGVALGAFGAHGLKPVLESHQSLQTWQTASLYHLLHAVVLLCLGWRQNAPSAPFWILTAGILIFSGSLYILAVTGIRKLGIVTPFGGVLLIVGWLLLLKSYPAKHSPPSE